MRTTKLIFGILAITCGLAVSGYSQTFLTNGLVAYYPFNGNANDASGNGARLTADRFGHAYSAYYFDGTNSYIRICVTAQEKSL